MKTSQKKKEVVIVFSIYQLEQMMASIKRQGEGHRCGLFTAEPIDKTQYSMSSCEVKE